jgi:hypothetical protein
MRRCRRPAQAPTPARSGRASRACRRRYASRLRPGSVSGRGPNYPKRLEEDRRLGRSAILRRPRESPATIRRGRLAAGALGRWPADFGRPPSHRNPRAHWRHDLSKARYGSPRRRTRPSFVQMLQRGGRCRPHRSPQEGRSCLPSPSSSLSFALPDRDVEQSLCHATRTAMAEVAARQHGGKVAILRWPVSVVNRVVPSLNGQARHQSPGQTGQTAVLRSMDGR